MKTMFGLLACMILLLCLSVNWAFGTVMLFDWAFNVNGDSYEAVDNDTLPGYFDSSGFNWDTGFGVISVTYEPGVAGSYSLMGFLDHEIDEADNTFFNEYGESGGAAPAGLSWEIDEPGYKYGDIYDNVLAGALDNTNAIPDSAPDDVSMALGWNFSLFAYQWAIITFDVTDIMGDVPQDEFYLAHTDPDSAASLYFHSTLQILGDPPDDPPPPDPPPGDPIPEPSTIILLLTGISGLAGVQLRRRRRS